MFQARIQSEPFDAGAEQARLSALGPKVGAVVSFVGQVRDTELFLEHYPAMAQRQLDELLAEARGRWSLLGAIIIHRYGLLPVSAPIVCVAVASSHRQEAFEAASFLMDWLKTKAPFWKKAPDGWVEAKDTDTAAAERWC